MEKNSAPARRLYGLLAEFHSSDVLLEAAHAANHAGYTKMDAYTPFPIEGLAEAVGMKRTRLPLIILIGGLLGGIGGFMMQYYVNVIAWPLNVGGKPLNSWPSFIPITFELTVLAAAFAAVLGMLGLNGLPMPYHPLFNSESFALASRDRFFLCIQSNDPKFDEQGTRTFLEGLKPHAVSEVEP